MICKIRLTKNNTVIIPTTIFCVRCDLLPPQCAHAQRQSRQTRYHDNISIPPENTNNHGSSQCGKTWKCAASGATNPTTANNIGRPQQNICGNIVAKIPILTALFFIDSCLVVLAIISVFTIIATNKILTIFRQVI